MAYYIPVEHQTPEVLSLKMAVKQLKMEDLEGFDDDLIQECIEAAIDEAESYTGANIRERKYILKSECWLPQDYECSKQVLQAVTKIEYLPEDGANATELVIEDTIELLPRDKYAKIIHYVDQESLPEVAENKTAAVSFEITVGYATGKVPKGLLQGIKLLMHENYNMRNNIETKGYTTAAQRKLEPYKYYRMPNE